MKNHVRTDDGRLLQTNKRWSALKESQKEKITAWFKAELSDYFNQHGKYPMGHKTRVVVDAVYRKIEEAGIWIPYGEVYKQFNSKKMKMIHQMEKKSNPQETYYLDMTDPANSCMSIVLEGVKIIQAGTTIYAMPVSEKNLEYDEIAEKGDIHFIFDDNVPKVNFYAVPRVDVFATVSDGGYLATYGEITDIESHSRILYISKDGEVRIAAPHLRKLISQKKSWKNNMQKTKMVKLYASKEEAMQTLPFFNIIKLAVSNDKESPAFEQIKRIQEMESILDKANAAVVGLPESVSLLQTMEDEIQKLIEYYESELWRQDFEADEAGVLPKDLKRGVLSEDGIYDFLIQYREALEDIDLDSTNNLC